MTHNGTAVLPTGTWMNPSKPETAEYYDAGQTAFVVREIGRMRIRIITRSSRRELPGWHIGTVHTLKHDPGGEYLGEYEVIGIRQFTVDAHTCSPGCACKSTPASYLQIGEVPNRAHPHWVFK